MALFESLAVVVILVLLCNSQTEAQVPNIPETFSAEIDVERHTRGETKFGNGILARDQKNMKGIEFYNITLSDNGNTTVVEVVLRLERYDLDPPVEYRVRGVVNDSHLHCSSEDVAGDPKLKPYFSWLEDAKDMGNIEIENVKVHLFVLEIAGTKFELGVDPDDINKPILFNRETPGEDVILTFKSFVPTVTDKDFDVPDICKGTPPSAFRNNGPFGRDN